MDKFFNNIGWKLGGDLNDITNNSEVSIDIPLGFVLHPQYLNNIVWQISRSTNNQQATINRNQKEWEVKLKFGYRKDIPNIFAMNQICVLSNGLQTKLGAWNAGYEFFFEWLRVNNGRN